MGKQNIKRLQNNDAKEVLRVIGNYTKALDLLDDYDHKSLIKPKGNKNNKKIINLKLGMELIPFFV